MKKWSLVIVVILIMFGAPAGITFATPIDLATSPPAQAGYQVTASDGSIWGIVDTRPTGTGVYMPFLRLRSVGTEAGLNTDAPGVYNNVGGIWTHSLMWGDLGTVMLNGVDYYSFTLDINEPANATDKYLSLDVFQLYAFNGPEGGSATDISQLGSAVYDFAGSNPDGPPVLMDYTLANSGSGNDDIEVLIPVTAIGAFNPNDFFYLYSQFGGVGVFNGEDFSAGNYSSQDGFEEWHALQGPSSPVPEPSTLLLLGSGLAGLGLWRRFKARS